MARLVPVLTVRYWCPVHWSEAGTGKYSGTTYEWDHYHTVDFAARPGEPVQRFGHAGMAIVRDYRGMMVPQYR